jgi:UPF0755 protein
MELIERMQAEQRKFLLNLWGSRAEGLPFNTPEEAITLASIVEKETGRADERDRVAGVFVNRLRKNMRLQSDPTIIYGLVGGEGTLGRGIRKDEIEKETPYNTYRIKGLPPGPIANPGRAAIEAVLNPADTKDLYFVADGTGGHAFAPNLAAHNGNVAKWREIERQRREEEEAKEREKARLEELARLEASGLAPPAEQKADAGAAEATQNEQSAVAQDPLLSAPGLSTGDLFDLSRLNLQQQGAGTSATATPQTPPAAAAAPQVTAPAAAQGPFGPDVPLPQSNPLRR